MPALPLAAAPASHGRRHLDWAGDLVDARLPAGARRDPPSGTAAQLGSDESAPAPDRSGPDAAGCGCLRAAGFSTGVDSGGDCHTGAGLPDGYGHGAGARAAEPWTCAAESCLIP